MHYGSEEPDSQHFIISDFPTILGVSERRAVRANGPVLMSGFLIFLDYGVMSARFAHEGRARLNGVQ